MRDPDLDGDAEESQQVSVSVPEGLKLGVYANFLVVSHSPHEFTLDFCQILPGHPPGELQAEVVSRLKVAPTMLGNLIEVLNSNMTTYEDTFGLVEDVD
jgi:hypothetical protein